MWLLSRSRCVFGASPLEGYDDSLSIFDNRTGRAYSIPIERNAIKATNLKQITADGSSLDPKGLPDTSGLKVVDRGFLNTACAESSITYIDGKRGTIHYHEHSLENIMRNNDYEEVIHLLNWGYLPTSEEKTQFRRALAANMKPPKVVADVIQAFPCDALTSSLILAGLSTWASVDEGTKIVHKSGCAHYVGNMLAVDAALIRTFSALATIIALSYCHKRNRPFTPANPNGSLIGNVLLMMGFTRNRKPDAQIERCLEKLWILYADHEMTNSTAASLHASSTVTDPISCLTSAIVSAYGPLHAVAIDMAYKGFEEAGSIEGVPKQISSVKAGKQRLYGYGHRIYQTADPRAKFIWAMIDEHKDLVYGNPMLQIAMEVDRVATSDDYFVSRGLKTNADLYGCFLYTAFGSETDIIVGMASLRRTGGCLAHWREAMQEKPVIWRPKQLFTGSLRRFGPEL
ncbi:citrate synthase [Zopfia rhizophila CBS 207.26]|uniref:Citrate synthase n=1 Tax=Zopfia rhizophila CBS 207.26 TaxID=1314779 RepID=A0A6A6EM93_9PEZI|nr:citrate synthase [Zopfia rhizophila CBS 207.26]